jgi:hypothetical protein
MKHGVTSGSAQPCALKTGHVGVSVRTFLVFNSRAPELVHIHRSPPDLAVAWLYRLVATAFLILVHDESQPRNLGANCRFRTNAYHTTPRQHMALSWPAVEVILEQEVELVDLEDICNGLLAKTRLSEFRGFIIHIQQATVPSKNNKIRLCCPPPEPRNHSDHQVRFFLRFGFSPLTGNLASCSDGSGSVFYDALLEFFNIRQRKLLGEGWCSILLLVVVGTELSDAAGGLGLATLVAFGAEAIAC